MSRLKQELREMKNKVVLWKLNNATWIICDSSQMFLKTSIDYEHKQSAISLLGFFLKLRPKRYLEPIKVLHKFYGEFDPGSGWTLAACLTHASRTKHLERITSVWSSLWLSGGRVSNAWVTCLVLGDSSWKRLVIPHKRTMLHDMVWKTPVV